MPIDSLWFLLTSEMFVNLAAAAVAGAAVVLNRRPDATEDRRAAVAVNFATAGVCLLLAFWFRKVGV